MHRVDVSGRSWSGKESSSGFVPIRLMSSPAEPAIRIELRSSSGVVIVQWAVSAVDETPVPMLKPGLGRTPPRVSAELWQYTVQSDGSCRLRLCRWPQW